MNAIVWMLPLSVALLALERLTYFLVWRHPDAFARLCAHPRAARLGEPVDALRKLFYLFKAIQIAVIVGWCLVFEDRGAFPRPTDDGVALLAGAVLVAFGQALNFLVFRGLGKTGVFYGSRFGHEVPWREGFPFSTFRHPQYVGAALTVWGVFLIMRYPSPDWFALPLAQTLLYLVSVAHEQEE